MHHGFPILHTTAGGLCQAARLLALRFFDFRFNSKEQPEKYPRLIFSRYCLPTKPSLVAATPKNKYSNSPLTAVETYSAFAKPPRQCLRNSLQRIIALTPIRSPHPALKACSLAVNMARCLNKKRKVSPSIWFTNFGVRD